MCNLYISFLRREGQFIYKHRSKFHIGVPLCFSPYHFLK